MTIPQHLSLSYATPGSLSAAVPHPPKACALYLLNNHLKITQASFTSFSYNMVINVTFCSVRGLNHPTERTSLFKELLKLGCGLICVQEVEFAQSKQGEVLIAVRNSLAFSLQEFISDPGGRYPILLCELNNRPFTVVNTYAPSSHQLHFSKRLFCEVSKIRRGSLKICRDFNIAADPHLDISSKPKCLSLALQPLLHSEDIFDAWRCQHTKELDYTFHSLRHNPYTRIDIGCSSLSFLPLNTIYCGPTTPQCLYLY